MQGSKHVIFAAAILFFLPDAMAEPLYEYRFSINSRWYKVETLEAVHAVLKEYGHRI